MRNIFSEDVAPYSFIGLVCNKELPSPRSQATGLMVNFALAAAMMIALMSATSDSSSNNKHTRYAAAEKTALNG